MQANKLEPIKQLEVLDVPSHLGTETLIEMIEEAEDLLDDIILSFIRERDPDRWWDLLKERTFYDQAEGIWIDEDDMIEEYMDFITGEWWDTYVTEILYPDAKQYDNLGNLIAVFGLTVEE